MAPAAEIGQHASAQAYEETNMEQGTEHKRPVVSTEAVQNESETRLAGSTRWGDAILSVFIALLPLYFVGFAIAAFVRDGTLASSFRNVAIFQMSKFNPTIFPILFTLIFAKFIKALANWKLERGATVGHIQHLLGSRSLVSAVVTPMRLGTASLLVPLLIMVWAMNPLGGQLSLRVVSKETNVTTIETPFLFVNPSLSWDNRAVGVDEGVPTASFDRVIENVFTTSLLSPNSSKNGTQDIFGNIQIPLLEYLMLNETTDSDGWLYTTDWDLEGIKAAIVHVAGVNMSRTKPIYASIVGLPYKANLTSKAVNTNSTESDHNARLQQVKNDLFGHDAVNIQSEFTIETSYMYADCLTKPLTRGKVLNYSEEDPVASLRSPSHFPNTTRGVANNGNGFSIAYDNQHGLNSTTARNITIRSWLGLPNNAALDNSDNTTETIEVISEASCTISQTYVEAMVRCPSQNNCTVAKMRESRTADRAHSPLTALDGATFPKSLITDSLNLRSIDVENMQRQYTSAIAKTFFEFFVNATTVKDKFFSPQNLSPLESYFARPDAPFKASEGANGASSGETGQRPITEIGDQLFSWRLSQLMNTYWLSSIEPFSVISGIDIDAIEAGDAKPVSSTPGRMYVERIVLRCHLPYFAVLLAISVGLCAIGLVTAYLDATRRGPDVLDDFVNSLRHNPYVHVDTLGPSMQDGQEISRRLRNTVVQMGDVRPDDHVGTGSTEIDDRLLVHLSTSLRCFSHYLIFSDLEENYYGEHVIDALCSVSDDIRANHEDFGIYRRLQQHGRTILDPSELSGSPEAFDKMNGNARNPGWKLDKWKFMPMVNRTMYEYPDMKWYVYIEADTFLLWSMLLRYLSLLDHTKPYYLGAGTCLGEHLFAHGGSGFVVSQPAMRQVTQHYSMHKAEIEALTDRQWAGDYVLGKTFNDAGVPCTDAWPHFQGDYPGLVAYAGPDGRYGPAASLREWCSNTISYHHMSSDMIKGFWDFEQQWITAHENRSDVLTHGNVFKEYVMPQMMAGDKVEWDNLSDEDEIGVSSMEDCRARCKAQPEYTMRAARRIRAGRFGTAIEVSSDVPLPKLASNLPDEHVLVNVHFTSLNPIDLKFPENPVISKFLKTTIPCLDFAGIVVSSSSPRFKTGEAVFGQTQPPNFGACAEYVVVGARHCGKVPEGVRLQDAATIGIAGLMAYQSIVPFVKANDRIFINGGSGGVGTYGIQIARAMDCSVIVACSGSNAELCKRMGAEKVVDYRTQDVSSTLEKSNEQFDLILDNVLLNLDMYWRCHKFLRPHGRYITTAIRPEVDFAWNALKVFMWPAVLGGGQRKFSIAARKSSTADYEQIAAWFQNGTVKPEIERVYDIDDAAEAFERLRSGRVRGKLVVKLTQSTGIER
ncbi:hypothetical protein MBLNU13_g10475t1 [Cladosporium sp. NU13]